MDRRNYSTYDPILEERPIPMIRFLSPLRAPAPGTALVLVPREGSPITIRHGESIPDARYGVHQYSTLVDLAEHRLAFEVPLVSSDPGFVFRGHVVVGCRVGEPAVVVARGIRDVGATLYDPIRQMLRPVARRFDIARFHEAEETLNDTLASFPGDSALRLRNSTVELLLDDDEIVRAGREFRDVTRETRLSAMRRERHLAMMRRDGAEGLLAEILEREGPSAVLQWIERAEASEQAELRAILDRLVSRTGVDREPFDHIEAERDVVNRITGGSNVPFGGTRSGRGRAPGPPGTPLTSASASVADEGHDTPPSQYSYPSGPTQPPTGPPPDAEADDDVPHGEARPRASRVRGVRRPDDGSDR